jgi:hypothetical protein
MNVMRVIAWFWGQPLGEHRRKLGHLAQPAPYPLSRQAVICDGTTSPTESIVPKGRFASPAGTQDESRSQLGRYGVSAKRCGFSYAREGAGGMADAQESGSQKTASPGQRANCPQHSLPRCRGWRAMCVGGLAWPSPTRIRSARSPVGSGADGRFGGKI